MKRFVSVTAFSGLLTLIRILAGILTTKYIAIYTGPSGIAMIGQVQSMATAINGVVSSPGANALVRYTAQYKNNGIINCAPWWSSSLKLTMLLLVPITVITLFGFKQIAEWIFGTEEYDWVVIAVIVALPFAIANTFLTSVLNGLESYKKYTALGFVSVIFSTLITLFLVKIYGLNGALISAAVASALAGIVMLTGCWKQPWLCSEYWFSNVNITCLMGVGSYVVMGLTSAVLLPLSQLVIRTILVEELGWNATGCWQAVNKISDVYLGVITVALSTYFLPKLSSLNDKNKIKKEIISIARLAIPTVILLSFSVFSFRDEIITILFSKEFEASRDLFAFQQLGDIVKIISWLYAYPMISTGAVRWFVITEIAFTIVLVILTYAFVLGIGIQGVVVAYFVSYCIYLIMVYCNFDRVLQSC